MRPYSVEQVRNLLATGELTGQELACREGLGDWTPLADLVALQREEALEVPSSTAFKYKAFISYSHQDKK